MGFSSSLLYRDGGMRRGRGQSGAPAQMKVSCGVFRLMGEDEGMDRWEEQEGGKKSYDLSALAVWCLTAVAFQG